MSLAKKRCVPCEGAARPLPASAARALLAELPGWSLSEDGRSIRRDLVFRDFMAAVRFVGAAARVAEQEEHHPDLHLTGYRRLRVELSTHAIGGLSENDFILAAKLDALPREER